MVGGYEIEIILSKIFFIMLLSYKLRQKNI